MTDDARRHENDSAVAAVADLLDGRSVASCESFTAGRVAASLARAECSADWFRGGVVPYQESVKRCLLKVTAGSVYSEQAAGQMALATAQLLNADVAVATSGVAGDEPMDGVAPGTGFIATIVDGETRAVTRRFAGSPERICEAAAHAALEELRAHLADKPRAEQPFANTTYNRRVEAAIDRMALDGGYD